MQDSSSQKGGRGDVETDVLRRLADAWAPEAAELWLIGHNSYLEGARPCDVLKHDPAAVLQALEATMWDGYA